MDEKEIIQYIAKQLRFVLKHHSVLDYDDLDVMAEGMYESIKNLMEAN